MHHIFIANTYKVSVYNVYNEKEGQTSIIMDFIKFCTSIKESNSVGVHNLTRYYKTEDSLMELS